MKNYDEMPKDLLLQVIKNLGCVYGTQRIDAVAQQVELSYWAQKSAALVKKQQDLLRRKYELKSAMRTQEQARIPYSEEQIESWGKLLRDQDKIYRALLKCEAQVSSETVEIPQ